VVTRALLIESAASRGNGNLDFGGWGAGKKPKRLPTRALSRNREGEIIGLQRLRRWQFQRCPHGDIVGVQIVGGFERLDGNMMLPGNAPEGIAGFDDVG